MNVEDIVREGTVTAIDYNKHIAKVWFDALGIGSAWMPVLINWDVIHAYPYNELTKTEFDYELDPDDDPKEGDKDFTRHRHFIKTFPWMPKVNDKVLVLYFPVFNGDGVILGKVQPWQ